MIPRYRAWDKIHKTMYGADDIMSIDFGKSEISVKTLFFERTNYYKFDDIVLMQSTGLTDKNGKEIFEGDILGTDGGLLDGVVEYRTDLGMWTNSLFRYNNFERLCSIANSREIIGNVWEDPELAEVSS
ncbi:MAG: hypothetical protein JTJ15_10820 [Streptococcus sp.]|nr:hypothetical protein [Streptococcus sp.]